MQFTHSGKPCRHRDRISRQGTSLVNSAERSNLLHHIQATAISAHRHAAADNLTERGEIRLNAIETLCAMNPDTETGHDFIDNEQSAMFFSFFRKRLQELRLRRDNAHVASHRFYYHTCDFVTNLVEKFLNARHIVVLERERVLCQVRRHTLAARLARREHSRASLDEQAIAMAMIAAFELHNLIATGKTASRTNRTHRRFGPAVHHANHLDAWHKAHHKLRKFRFKTARGAKTEAILSCIGNSLNHGIVRMPQKHRAPAAHVINVIVAIHIVNVAALGTLDKRRRRPHIAKRTHRTVHAARHERFCFCKQLFAQRVIHITTP